MEDNTKEVYYSEYCKKCAHKDVKETDEPCNECLSEPARQFTHKPAMYKEKQ